MNYRKSILALIFITILSLAVLLTSCATPTTVPPTATSAPTAGPTIDPYAKYSPAISVTTVRTNPNPALVYPTDGYSIDKNAWIDAYANDLGINVSYLWTCDASQFDQKRNIMIASGDIPDFFLATPTMLQQLVDADLLADLTDAYGYVNANTKSILEDEPEILDAAKFGGKLYAIPFTGFPKEGEVHMIYIRTDWMTKLNLSAPKTMADVIAIAKAFTTQDPDGNSTNDTVGICLDKDFADQTLGKTQNGIFNSYHAYPDVWLKDDSGKLVYGSIQPEVKTALAALQELYAAGVIAKDFGVKDSAKAFEDISAGKCGLFFSSFDAPPYPMQASIDNDPKAEWQSYPLVSIDSKPALAQHDLGTFGYWVVSKKCKNPEVVVKLMNVWFDKFYFNKDDSIVSTYVAYKGSALWQDALVTAYKPFANAEFGVAIRGVLKGDGALADLMPNARDVYKNIIAFQGGDAKQWWYNEVWGEGGTTVVTKYYSDNDLYKVDAFYGAPTATMVEKGATLKAKEAETFISIIMGASLDEFDKFVTDWKALGGDQITKEVNDWNASR
jgi:putative aldouronate transport system substrate-binding protein